MKMITLSEILRYDTEENIKNKFLNSSKSLIMCKNFYIIKQ